MDDEEGRIGLTPFDHPNVVAGDPGLFGEVFLREAEPFSVLSHELAKGLDDGMGHRSDRGKNLSQPIAERAVYQV